MLYEYEPRAKRGRLEALGHIIFFDTNYSGKYTTARTSTFHNGSDGGGSHLQSRKLQKDTKHIPCMGI